MRALRKVSFLFAGTVGASCSWGLEFLEERSPQDGAGGMGGVSVGGASSGGASDGGAPGDGGADAVAGSDAGGQGPCMGAPFIEWFEDADGDGYGDPDSMELACEPPGGFVSDGTDCADAPSMDPACNDLAGEECHPGLVGLDACDGADNDCDGDVDEDCFPDPPPITMGTWDPLLWLDAADVSTFEPGAPIAEWRDKSGSDRHATQFDAAKPPVHVVGGLNELGVLRFDGVDDSLTVDNSAGDFDTTNITIMFVVAPRWQADPGVNPSPFAIRGESGGLTRFSTHFEGDLSSFMGFASGIEVFSDFAFTPEGFHFIEYSITSGGVENHYLNGELWRSHSHGLDPATVLQPVRIGAAEDEFEHFEGDIAEVIVFGRTLLASERDSIEAYIEAKWGIDTSP